MWRHTILKLRKGCQLGLELNVSNIKLQRKLLGVKPLPTDEVQQVK
jgi:hypothetical protein